MTFFPHAHFFRFAQFPLLVFVAFAKTSLRMLLRIPPHFPPQADFFRYNNGIHHHMRSSKFTFAHSCSVKHTINLFDICTFRMILYLHTFICHFLT